MVTQKLATKRRVAFGLNIDGPIEQKETVALRYVRSRDYGQAERTISNGKLHWLPNFHIRPIKLVVFQCSSYFRWEISS